ncbi:flagellar biosynthetic protein FliO [Pseudomonas sp. 148P]|uniref:Flagellar protein n=1 Tax=Pseudomonas ulcerans TaxID=3115852 RepID=A0ABU7HJL6_9PSED|nr:MULTISPECIES: flagellar biosynthetic protein FliO [unclassified Pseudomonas]MEE1921422.1 flagellar biosynthetic protein FliO [Pseudomonas sp. 147P]MEE1931705.1 flagellar biosynthetic protein FliO [Pseudomonas sp. 148P]
MSASAIGVPADDLVGLTVLGKTALALGMVAACILLCGWLVSRLGVRPSAAGSVLKVIGSARMGQREKVVVVEVRGRWLVLGVTAQQVACLSELEAPPGADDAPGEPVSRGFALRLADALKRGGARDPEHPA